MLISKLKWDWKRRGRVDYIKRCYARSPSPHSWENKTSTAMQTQKGNLLLARARAQVSSNTVEWDKGPEPWITAVFIGLKQTGSWQGRIGCKGSLASTNWLVFRCAGFLGGGFRPCPDKLKPGYREYSDWSSPGACRGWSQLLGNNSAPL